MVEYPVVLGSETGITAIDELLTSKLLEDCLLQRSHGNLFVLIAREEREGQRDPVPINEKPHLDDRIRTMFFTFTVFPVAIFLFDLKVVVGAVMKGIQKQSKGK